MRLFKSLIRMLGTVVVLVEKDDIPPYDPFVSLDLEVGDHVVALNHRVAGAVCHRHVDPEGVEDIYVIDTEVGVLVVPEAYLRPALS